MLGLYTIYYMSRDFLSSQCCTTVGPKQSLISMESLGSLSANENVEDRCILEGERQACSRDLPPDSCFEPAAPISVVYLLAVLERKERPWLDQTTIDGSVDETSSEKDGPTLGT